MFPPACSNVLFLHATEELTAHLDKQTYCACCVKAYAIIICVYLHAIISIRNTLTRTKPQRAYLEIPRSARSREQCAQTWELTSMAYLCSIIVHLFKKTKTEDRMIACISNWKIRGMRNHSECSMALRDARS